MSCLDNENEEHCFAHLVENVCRTDQHKELGGLKSNQMVFPVLQMTCLFLSFPPDDSAVSSRISACLSDMSA